MRAGAIWIQLPEIEGTPPWECPLCRSGAVPRRGEPGSYVSYGCDGGYMNKGGRPGRLARDIVQRRWPRLNPRSDGRGNWTPYRACQQPPAAVVVSILSKRLADPATGERLQPHERAMARELLAPAAALADALVASLDPGWAGPWTPVGAGLPVLDESSTAPSTCPVCGVGVWMRADGIEVSPMMVRYRCDGEYIRLLRRDEAQEEGYRIEWRANAPCCNPPLARLAAAASSSATLPPERRDEVAVVADLLAQAGV